MTEATEILTRRAPSKRKTSWDAETRTLTAVVSTFADVRRWFGVERLSRAAADWDLSRVNSPAGVPLLLAHNAYSPNAKIGRVLSVEVGKREVTATMQLSRRPEVEPLIRDLEDGIGLAISFGYAVRSWEINRTKDQPEIRTAKGISVLEVSIVNIAADAGAHARSLPMPEAIEETVTTETRHMADAERQRVSGIDVLVRRLGLDDAFRNLHVEAGTDIRQVREAALEEMRARSARTRTDTRADVLHNAHSLDNPQVRAAAMGEALYARLDPSADLSEPARQFAGLTVPELARHSLQANGQAVTAMSPASLVTRALHTTSDFPQLLADTVGRSLRAAYQAAPSAIKQVARKTTARDFRAKHHLTFSEAPRLEKVNEHGEFKRGTFKEAAESYKVDTFGRVFGITRQALINDDLSAFERVPRALGQAAEAFEAQFLVDHLQSNPQMADGKGVFHADHGNLAAAAAPLSTEALSTARTAMRRQTGLTGELIAVAPKYLIVAPELETIGEQVLAEIAAAKTEDVNVFAKSLTLVVEPRLTLNSGLTWYLSAPTSQIDGLEYAYLEGFEGPYLESRAGFDIDGIEIKVRLDFGAGFIDHRGWYRNDGAADDD